LHARHSLAVNNYANAKPLSPTGKYVIPCSLNFAGFPWIENVARILQLHRCLGEGFEKWKKQIVSGLSIERADLKMEETKHVSKQRFS